MLKWDIRVKKDIREDMKMTVRLQLIQKTICANLRYLRAIFLSPADYAENV